MRKHLLRVMTESRVSTLISQSSNTVAIYMRHPDVGLLVGSSTSQKLMKKEFLPRIISEKLPSDHSQYSTYMPAHTCDPYVWLQANVQRINNE